jgi:DNA polymerase-3 subunit epsilon
VDFDLVRHKTIDVQTIFHKMEKRTLGAALQFYCDKELINAHSAMADTEATCDVLLAQLERYKELKNNTAFLSEFSSHKRTVDVAGFIVYNKEDQPTFSFGKHKGKTVDEVLEKEPGYFGWLLNADFPLYTKKILTALRLRKFNSGS